MSNYAYTPNQTQAITHLHSNVRVIAGAGSGKTKVLVKRYLYILGDNYQDDPLYPEYIVANSQYAQGEIKAQEILAITFTEKAGKEMSERIYQRLSSLVANTNDKEYWQKCAADLAGAHVGTMHSLYSKIIRENPIEAQIETDFSILNALNEEYAKKTFNTAYLNKLLKHKDKCFTKLYANYSLKQLGELMELVVRNAATLPSEYAAFVEMFAANMEKTGDLQQTLLEFRELLSETFSASNLSELNKKSSKTNAALLDLHEQAQLFENCSYDQYLLILDKHKSVLHTVFGVLRTNSKIGGELKKVYQKLNEARLLVAVADKAQTILPSLTEFLFTYLNAWNKYKKDNNFLTFDDTEMLCLKLLHNFPIILDKYQGKYKHVLIDEVQDLSEAQHQIIELLTAQPSTILFSVGDKKQAIYGFRGSSIHSDTKAEQTINLDINFRSQAGIIDVCNGFFENYTGTNANNVQFEGLVPHRESVSTNVHTAFFEKGDLNELDYISKYILYLQQEQKVALNEIAILVRTNAQTEQICKCLEQYQINYRVSGRNGFFQDRYVMDLLNLLICINNKYAQIELIAILRSPFCAISDQSITELYACRENLWEALADESCRQTTQQAELLNRAYQTLRVLSEHSKYLPISQLLKEIIYTHNWQNIILLHGDKLQNLSNLNKFWDLVSEFEETHSPYIAEFIEYITVLQEALSKEEMPNITDSRQLGVNIMSIHKSKGLEFSYVFLPQLQKISIAAKGGGRIYQFDNNALQIGLRFPVEQSEKYESSMIYNRIKEQNRQLDEYESLRILYVAMTRARDFLVLSGTRTTAKDGSLNNALEWLITYAPPECLPIDFNLLQELTLQPTQLTEAVDELEYQHTLSNCAAIYNNEQTALTKLTASALHDYQLCPLLFKYKHVLGLPDINNNITNEDVGNFENSALIGTLVHRLLEQEQISLEDELLQDLADYEQQRVLNIAKQLFANYQHSRIYQAIQPYILQREYPFTLFDKELRLLLNGIVDCVLLMPDDTLGIVDYKTGRNFDEYLPFYKLQISLYAQILEELLHKPVSYLALHHIGEAVREIKLSPAEQTVCRQELRHLITEILAKTSQEEFEPNTDYCRLCRFTYLCPRA